MVRASQLKDVRILSCFTEPELEQVASLSQPKSFEAHSNIIIEGECH